MSIKDIINKIKSGFSWFVGDHASQQVKAGRLSKEDAKVAIEALEKIDSEGNNLGNKIKDSVQLYPGDIENIKVGETPKPTNNSASGGKGKSSKERDIERE